MECVETADLDAVAALLTSAAVPLARDVLLRRLGGWSEQRLARALDSLSALGAVCEQNALGIFMRVSDPLARGAIRRALISRPDVEVTVVQVCDSTNDLARSGKGRRAAVAEAQTAGRGRRGSRWLQPFGSGLALSVGAPAPGGRPDTLALAMAVAVADALDAAGYRGIGLKWPNDLYARGRKLGGILVEAYGGASERIVVGLGLNVHIAPSLRDRPAIALAEIGSPPRRSDLAGALARALFDAVERFDAGGFATFARRFSTLDLVAGREITLRRADGMIRGVARGVAEDGALLVETPAGLERHTSGEVSLGAWAGV